jgi:hypothetical protein
LLVDCTSWDGRQMLDTGVHLSDAHTVSNTVQNILSNPRTPVSNICRPSQLVQSTSKSQFSVSVRADPTCYKSREKYVK